MKLSTRQTVKQASLLNLSEEFIDKVWSDVGKEIVLSYNEKTNIFDLKKLDLSGGYTKKFIISTKDFLNDIFKGQYFPSREFYVYLFPFENEVGPGYFDSKNNSIVIFFNKDKYENLPLKSILASFKSTLRHELVHLAQYFFKDFLKSKNKNISPFFYPHKKDDLETYLTSNVEFHPLIVTQFSKFVEQIKNAKSTQEEYLYLAKVFLQGNVFFKKLFKLDENLFNLAIKKFFKMINDNYINYYKKDYVVPNITDDERTYGYLEEKYDYLSKKYDSEEELIENNLLNINGSKLSIRVKTANETHDKQVALMKFLSQAAIKLGVAEHVYVVGGAVRDFIIGHPIKDVDVVIDAVSLKGKDSAWFASQLQSVIPVNTSLVTNNYGVAILTIKDSWEFNGHDLKGEVIEIANARQESYGGEEGKGYKPSQVNLTNIQEDVFRREFTFNTLMWRLSQLAEGPDKAEIVDLTGCGLKDLKQGEMACPSDPDKTFSDDPTRMLRAIKFLIRYGWKITPEVKSSIKRNANKLKNIPYEAVFNILVNNILKESTYKIALIEMKELGLLDVVSEMIKESKEMSNAFSNWSKDQKVQFLLDLIKEGVPSITKFDFLSNEQKEKFKEQMPNLQEPEVLIDILKQPGKAIDIPYLMKELNIKGPQVKLITNMARDVALNTPEIIKNKELYTYVVSKKLKGE